MFITIKTIRNLLSSILLLILFPALLQAQISTTTNKTSSESLWEGTSDFQIRGYSTGGYSTVEDEDGSFFLGKFNPLFLWRHGDKFLFESEAELELEGDEVELALEYANFSYIINNYVTFRVGKFLTPFGAFVPNIHPNWINKLPTFPVGLANMVRPGSEIGAELRGAASIGPSRINYSFYLSNGPSLSINVPEEEETEGAQAGTKNTVEPAKLTNTSPAESGSIATVNFGSVEDNNNSPAVGGRLGFSPFNNSNLEVGFSGQFSKIGDSDTPFEDVNSKAFAIDGTYIKNSFSAIKGNLDIRGQWTRSGFDNFNVTLPDGDALAIDLDQDSYYAQIAYRPAMLNSSFMSKLEFVVRYSNFDAPTPPAEVEEEETVARSVINSIKFSENSPATTLDSAPATGATIVDREEISIGIDFWLSWRSVLKLNYEVEYLDGNNENISSFFATWAFGF